jgi:hypothetical protein
LTGPTINFPATTINPSTTAPDGATTTTADATAPAT